MRPCKALLQQRWLEVLVVFLLTSSLACAGDLTAKRKGELRNLVVQDCGSCHGMTLNGGLGSALKPSDLDGVEPATIAQIILDGVPGKPMPPWRGLLSENEAVWIALALKSGALK